MNRIAIALSLPVGAALLLQANPSHALTTITVGGTAYEIEYFTGTLSDLFADPIAPPSSNFPWFGLPALAIDFANALFAEGSAPTQTIQDASTLSGDVSVQPLFLTSSTTFAAYDLVASASGPFICDTGIAVDCEQGSIIWAYVPAAAPVPAPLPLLGAAAAFSFSRKLRRRVNAQKFTF
jgi:hypothetical protein